jgi:hypothetical protein
MTIIDSINILVLYFLDHTSLKFTDIDKLVPKDKKSDKEACIASLVGALNSPKMSELLQTVTPIPNDINSLYYILKQPLYFNKQQIDISGVLALQVSQIVNSYVENDSDQSNPLGLVENDIQHLINIISFLSNEKSEENSQQIKEK